jgi:hypothetical protein
MRATVGVALTAVAMTCSCAEPVSSPQGERERGAVLAPTPIPTPSYFIHVVKFRGETLGQITEWYTGRYNNWRSVARANGLAVPNELLSIGKEVKVPSQLVVRQDPMPAPKRKRTPKVAPPGKAAEQSSGAAPEESSEPALPPVIGPK